MFCILRKNRPGVSWGRGGVGDGGDGGDKIADKL